MTFSWVADSWAAPIRLAGTCSAYSGKAINQLTRMANGSQALRNFKCPYQAAFMKAFEQIKSAMVFTKTVSRMCDPTCSGNRPIHQRVFECPELQALRNYSSVLGNRIDGDLGSWPQSAGHQVAQTLVEDFFDVILHLLEFDLLARLAVGGQNEVKSELGLDDVAHMVGLKGEGGLGKGIHHGAGAGKVAEIPTLRLGWAGG